EGRAHASGPARQPLPPDRRRRRRPFGDLSQRRQRERTRLPAAAARRAQRAWPRTARGLGRPRLLLPPARARTPRPRLRAAPEQTTPRRRADPARHLDPAGLARPPTPAAHTRPTSPPPLASRTNQRLAEITTPHRHPLRPQSRQLPRLPPTPRHPHPHPPLFRSTPDTGTKRKWTDGRLQA